MKNNDYERLKKELQVMDDNLKLSTVTDCRLTNNEIRIRLGLKAAEGQDIALVTKE